MAKKNITIILFREKYDNYLIEKFRITSILKSKSIIIIYLSHFSIYINFYAIRCQLCQVSKLPRKYTIICFNFFFNYRQNNRNIKHKLHESKIKLHFFTVQNIVFLNYSNAKSMMNFFLFNFTLLCLPYSPHRLQSIT